MPRPTTKRQLIDLSTENFDKLTALVDSFTPEQLIGEFPFEDRDRNIRDVLAHLHEWHLMMANWYADGMSGSQPEIPAPGYTWRMLPDLNNEIWRRYQEVDLPTIRQRLADSHAQVMALVAAHSDAELFEKKRYPWTGSTSLGAYLISSTSSHYDWALKKLRKYRREGTR